MMIGKLDRCERERDLKSTTQTLTDLRREQGRQDHSMKHCEQTWNGTAKIGKLTGRELPLHHLRNNGGNMNTKTLNGEINIGGKSVVHRLVRKTHRIYSQVRHWRMSCTRPGECEDRTPRRTHFFSASRTYYHHTHLLVAQGLDVLNLGICCTFCTS